MIIENKIKLFFISLLLISCTENKSVVGSVDDAKNWFESHKGKVLQINELLLQHPKIRRIDPDYSDIPDRKHVPNYELFDTEDKSVYKTLEDICKELHIINIAVSRVNEPSNKFISTAFLLARPEFFGNKKVISVEYIPDESELDSFKKNKWMPYELDIKGWYVIDNLDP